MGKKNREDIDTGVGLRERMNYKLDEPHHYSIIMLNDDFTPMDFVVMVLMSVFHKTEKEATELMLAVHKGGQAIVGRYTYDIAVTKKTRVDKMAKEQGYPFRVEIKES